MLHAEIQFCTQVTQKCSKFAPINRKETMAKENVSHMSKILTVKSK